MVITLLSVICSIIYGMSNHAEAGQRMLTKTVTVLVNLNGGNVNGNTEYALVGTPGERVILTNPIYEGFEFIGYHCCNGTITVDNVCNTVYTFGNTNTVITALWKEQSENLIPIETPVITTQQAIYITETPKAAEMPRVTEIPEVTIEPKIVETIMPSIVPGDIDVRKVKIYLEKNIYYVTYKNRVKPNIKITYNGKKLIEKKDYKLTFQKNNHYGKAKIIIEGIGNYTGTTTRNFYILPVKTKITKCGITVKNKGEIIKIVWKKLKGVDGYQILYSKEAKGAFKEISKKSLKQTSAVFWFLGKEIYIKVRPYVIIDGKYKYGEYSNMMKAVKK